MSWKPHVKFAMPGVIALFVAALLGRMIPCPLRIYVYISIVLTLLLGLLTGQFHLIGAREKLRSLSEHAAATQEAGRPISRTIHVLGLASLFLGVAGVAAPLTTTFSDAVEQCFTAAIGVAPLVSDEFISADLLVYSLIFVPVNAVALTLALIARRSRFGKAGMLVSVVGLCLPVGAVLGLLMIFVMLWIWPPVFPPFN